VEPAGKLLSHRKPEVRFIALYLLHMLQLPEGRNRVIDAVEDEDIRIAVYAGSIATGWLQIRMSEEQRDDMLRRALPTAARQRHIPIPPKDSGDLFERLERLLARIPEKPKEMKPLVWPWLKVNVSREGVADALVVALGERPRAKLLPYLAEMSPNARKW